MAQRLTASDRRALRQEAGEWDRLDDEEFARLFETGSPVRVRIRRPLPRILPIALDQPTLNGLKRIARRKQVETRHLAAIWIAERLAQEQAGSRRPRMA